MATKKKTTKVVKTAAQPETPVKTDQLRELQQQTTSTFDSILNSIHNGQGKKSVN